MLPKMKKTPEPKQEGVNKYGDQFTGAEPPGTSQLYEAFAWGEKQRQELHNKALAKGLDVPIGEDVNVSTTTTTGIQIGHMVGLAGIVAVLGLIAMMMRQPAQAPAEPAAQPAPVGDRDYVIRFFDADGNPIKVPNIAERKETK